jgi:hypothetical protein
MIRRAALAVVLSLSAAAFADGDQPKAPAAKAAPAAKDADAPSGFKATVTLNNGRSLSGVVRVAGSWERHDEKAGWVACGKDDAGASVRLWYVSGGDGFLVIAAKSVKSVEDLGALDAADLKKIAAESDAAGRRADAERDQLRKEREAKRLAAEKAAAAAPKPLTPEEVAKKAALDAWDKRAAELLVKFPPKDWNVERRDEINRRALIMKLMPSKEEREFVDNFADWSKAAAAAAAKEVADKKDAEKAAGDKPVEKKDDDSKGGGKKSDDGKGGGKKSDDSK